MYDGVLQLPLPSSTDIVGFADDVALVVVAKEVAAVEAAANCAIRAVEVWLAVAGLELASHKTEVLILSRKAVESVHIQIGGSTITAQRGVRKQEGKRNHRIALQDPAEYQGTEAGQTQAPRDCCQVAVAVRCSSVG